MAAASANAFRAALGRIGFSVAAQDAVTDPSLGGINEITLLARLQKEQVKRICKVLRDNDIPISILAEQMFEVMHYWVKQRLRLQQPVTAALFTEDVAEDAARKYNTAQEEQTVRAAEREGVKLPEKFKASTVFKIYDEVMDTYLNAQIGTANVPLNYVIRKNDEAEPDDVYANESEEAVALAPLEGDAFDRDNRRVYQIIKGLIIEGPAWAYITPAIDRVKDGRAAWLALRNHYGSESFMNRDIEEAHNAIDALHYKKEYANFTFETFITSLTQHYNTLERHGEFITEETKVRNLLKKITDPSLEAAKQAIKINEAYKTDFSAAANFLSTSVTPLTPGRSRNISSLHRNGGKDKQSHRGRGHYQQRGGRGGRTGRFGGRGGGRGGRGRGGGRGGRSNSTYIPPEEWATMTREQRDSVLENRGTKRNVSEISTTADSQVVPVQVNTPAQSSNVSVITTDASTTQAGREFGRQAHRG